ncbi:MAG: WG repeat-containing protein, partial [Zoogloeaceae bacterium]|nr:WG repeat-containing protein [Zoogloeaceae bacterium]
SKGSGRIERPSSKDCADTRPERETKMNNMSDKHSAYGGAPRFPRRVALRLCCFLFTGLWLPVHANAVFWREDMATSPDEYEGKDLLAICVNQKCGYINAKGEKVVPLRFNEVLGFTGYGPARVKLKGKYGFINATGKEIISIRFDQAGDFSANGLARVLKNGKWGYINAAGKTAIPFRFDSADGFGANALARVSIGKKYGYINAKGKAVIPIRYSGVWGFSSYSGLSTFGINGKVGCINAKGKEVIPAKFDSISCTDFRKDGDLARAHNGNNKSGYVNIKGEVIVPFKYYTTNIFTSSGLASVQYNGKTVYVKGAFRFDGKTAYVNTKGEEIIPPIYDWGSDFEGGLAAVKLKGEWGYINTRGEVIIPFGLGGFWAFPDANLVVVRNDQRKFGLMNFKGEPVIPFRFDELYVSGDFIKAKLNGKQGYLDLKGKEVIPIRFDEAYHFSGGLARVKLDGKWGCINPKGEEVFPIRFDAILCAKEEARAKRDGKHEFINTKGETIRSIRADRVVDRRGKELFGSYNESRQDWRVTSAEEFFYLFIKGKGWGVINAEDKVIIWGIDPPYRVECHGLHDKVCVPEGNPSR